MDVESVKEGKSPLSPRRSALLIAGAAAVIALVAAAAVALANSGGPRRAAHSGKISFQPCLSFTTVVTTGPSDDGYRPTARRALTDAIAGQPAYVFTGRTPQLLPPSGNWQVDERQSKSDEIQFDHVSTAGTVDWVALVGYGSQSGVGMRAEQGWQYEIGSPWPSRDKQVPC